MAAKLYRLKNTIVKQSPSIHAILLQLPPTQIFLFDQQRAGEVLQLTSAKTDSDILLLRRVLAAHQLKLANAAALANRLAIRYDIARTRSDQLHLREEARFVLHVREQPCAALTLAMTN